MVAPLVALGGRVLAWLGAHGTGFVTGILGYQIFDKLQGMLPKVPDTVQAPRGYDLLVGLLAGSLLSLGLIAAISVYRRKGAVIIRK